MRSLICVEPVIVNIIFLYYMITLNTTAIFHYTRARFLSLARSKLRLCSANHRPCYWSNLPCDWPRIAWAYSEQETENGPSSYNVFQLILTELHSIVRVYRKTSNIGSTKSPNLNDSRLVLQLSLPNTMKPCVKLRMKTQLKQRRQAPTKVWLVL